MKLIEMKCKNCGAKLKVDSEAKEAHCEFCGVDFKIDDEVQHHKFDDMEQAGYEFEKGKIRAQKEHGQNKTQVVYVNNNSSNSNLKNNRGCLFYFICLMFFPFVITYYVIKSEKLSKGAKIGILSALWIFIVICGIINSFEEKDLEKNHWATECTQLSDFEYILDSDSIIMSDYNGSDKRIKVCDKYTVNNKEYKVTKFSEGVFALSSVYSVILPEGLVSIPANTFNSSGVKYLYIPSTLQSDKSSYSFYSYLHDVEAIYYGGSEEQWHTLTNNVEREKIESKIIEYNYKIEDLK